MYLINKNNNILNNKGDLIGYYQNGLLFSI